MRIARIALALCLAACGSVVVAQPPVRLRPPIVQDLPVAELLNYKIQLAAKATELRAAEIDPYVEANEIVRLATEIENLRSMMVVILGEYPELTPLLGTPEMHPNTTGGPAWDSGWNRYPTVIDLAAIRGLQSRLTLTIRQLIVAQSDPKPDPARLDTLTREIRGIVAEIFNFGGAYPALEL